MQTTTAKEYTPEDELREIRQKIKQYGDPQELEKRNPARYQEYLKDYEYLQSLKLNQAVREADHDSRMMRIQARMEHNGLKDRLKNSRFETFDISNEWQRQARAKVVKYTQSVLAGSTDWLYIGGQSGSGKSHLCLSVVNVLFNYEQMVWCESYPQMINTLTSRSYGERSDEAKQLLKTVKNEPILYIDDFLKGYSEKREALRGLPGGVPGVSR